MGLDTAMKQLCGMCDLMRKRSGLGVPKFSVMALIMQPSLCQYVHLIVRMLGWEETSLTHLSSLPGFKCPICSKSVASDEMEMHFIMCLSKPRLSYNGKDWARALWVKVSWLLLAPAACEQV